MPLIVCARCGRNYDVPGPVAVRLPTSIATCECGEWLSGSKAALLARLLNPEEIREVDMKQYEVDPRVSQQAAQPIEDEPFDLTSPRSVRIVARGAHESINQVFTIGEHPLWIGRKGCHIELDDADLSIRHCSISVRGAHLVLRDADSYTGTFLDGQPVTEAAVDDGIHLLRVGSALVTIEPVSESGSAVEPIRLDADSVLDTTPMLLRKLQERARGESSGPKRQWLVCLEGPLSGQEYEIPPLGLTVGREGDVRVPDEYLSRKHFEVMPDADGMIHVRDLGSRNGTFLNTLPAKNTRVHPGDEIRAGLNRFRVEERG